MIKNTFLRTLFKNGCDFFSYEETIINKIMSKNQFHTFQLLMLCKKDEVVIPKIKIWQQCEHFL